MNIKHGLIVALILFCMNGGMVVADVITHPLRSLDTDYVMSDDFSDLAALGDAIGDKTVVMLDELTHGEGNVFAYKTRIVQYLHQRKGFDVLVLESGLFDVAKIWQQQQDLKPLAAGNIFYMYARSRQMQPLFHYIDQARNSQKPLALAGFDGRLSGQISTQQLVPALRHYLRGYSAVSSYQSYLLQVQQLLDGQLTKAEPNIQQEFLQSNLRLAAMLNGRLPAGEQLDAGFWYRINASLRKMALVTWQKNRFDEHDLAMAANLQWLIDHRYAGRKIIVWGHYIHLNRAGGFQNSLYEPHTPIEQRISVANMTTALKQSTLEKTYVLHFAGARGSYIDFRDMQEVAVVNGGNSLESHLTRQGDVFVPLQQALDSSILRLWGHEYKTTLSWQQAQQRFDGMVLLQNLTPVQMLP